VLHINIVYNLIQKFKEMDKTVKQIIILSIIVIILFIGTTILKKLNSKNEFTWNYKEINELDEVLEQGVKVYDRILYLELKTIIDNIIDDSNTQMTENGSIDFEHYYEFLTKSYKRYLGKEKYKTIMNEFINKYIIENDTPPGVYSKMPYRINEINKYNDNMYLCEIKSDENEYITYDDDGNILGESQNIYYIGYIGIELNEIDSTYNIFYME